MSQQNRVLVALLSLGATTANAFLKGGLATTKMIAVTDPTNKDAVRFISFSANMGAHFSQRLTKTSFLGNRTCDPDQFTCIANGQCIALSWMCDGQADCPDGSDEYNDQCQKRSCSNEEFTCANGKCITKRWKCDQENDCDDNSDEADCREL